jgi:hypothetical protein
MLQLQRGRLAVNCRGISRRTAIKVGFSGLLGLGLPELLRLRASGVAEKNARSVILLWLDGGPSHLETYDPKPEAPSEYRGPWTATRTNVPGIYLSESMSEQAKLADKMVFLRSVHHKNGDHFAAAHWMLTGRFGSSDSQKAQKFPSVGSFVARVRGAKQKGMPAYVGLPSAESVYLFPGYQGAAYLGAAFNPFDVNNEQRYLGAADMSAIQAPRCLGSLIGNSQRLESRLNLLENIDQLRRDVDATGGMEAMDTYQHQAMDLVLGGRARDALDIEKESPQTRDRYGRGPWGHYALMARRLVEAGVSFVTVDMPHWDDHSNIKEGHGRKVPVMDRAAAALISDLSERGMLQDTLVVVMGEFGRTPKINEGQPGIPIPGRDHWGDAFSVMMAGGGLRGGQVIGATNAKGEYPVERPLGPEDILATVYHVMGIDPKQTFNDLSGRPVSILDHGEVIREIV